MREIPDGFEADARAAMSNAKLMKKYHVCLTTLEDWRFQLNIPPNPIGGKRKPVSQYDADGNYIRTYPSVRAAGDEIFGCYTAIGRAARIGCQSYGYYWKYGGNDND